MENLKHHHYGDLNISQPKINSNLTSYHTIQAPEK